MNRPLFVLLLSLSIPAQSIAAHADAFCDGLKKVVAQTPGKYRAMAQEKGSPAPATFVIPGFADEEKPGTRIAACTVSDAPNYACLNKAPLPFDPVAAARQCLAGWKETAGASANRLKETIFSNAGTTVSLTVTSDDISYRLVVQPSK